MANNTDDPLPAYLIGSWLVFLVPTAYISVHGPDAVEQAAATLWLYVDQPPPAESVLQFVRGVSTVSVFVLFAVLFSGYLLYSFPLPARSSRVPTYVLALATCALCFLLYPFSAWVWGGVWRFNWPNGLFVFFAWLLYLFSTTTTRIRMNKGYVLFLRRFDSFADLSVLPHLLRLTPRGLPIATLVSSMENETGYWDPLKLTTYGLHATGWYGGRPAFIRGGANWESTVSDLVARASAIVLDKSDVSAAIAKELRTVARSDRPVILIAESDADAPSTDTSGVQGTEIVYRRDRRHLFVRSLMVLLIVIAMAALVDLPDQIRDKHLEGVLWEGLVGGAIMLALVAALAGGLLLRKGLSASTQRELRAALLAAIGPRAP
ncbi:MAG: hypothetical protein AAF515_01750 [Pseudomonadota bacterium]